MEKRRRQVSKLGNSLDSRGSSLRKSEEKKKEEQLKKS